MDPLLESLECVYNPSKSQGYIENYEPYYIPQPIAYAIDVVVRGFPMSAGAWPVKAFWESYRSKLLNPNSRDNVK